MSMSTTVPAAESYRCRWCDCYHMGMCPMVTAIEYHPNGQVKRVEFWQNGGRSEMKIAPLTEEEIARAEALCAAALRVR